MRLSIGGRDGKAGFVTVRVGFFPKRNSRRRSSSEGLLEFRFADAGPALIEGVSQPVA
jgi:hypothetical protein